MAVLVLNAGTASPISLAVQAAGENAPSEVGGITPSFNGVDRSSIRAVKRSYGSLMSFLDTATKDSVINLLKNGKQIPCSGDLLANIQTQCTVRYQGAKMRSDLPGLWEVSLALNEVQPSNTLLRYSPGDTITGESFTRSTTGWYIDASAILRSAAINVKRDGHYIGGVRSTLLEDTRTNSLLWSSDFTNAAWSKVTMTTASGVTGPDNTASASTLTATAGNATASQTLSAGSSIVRTNSCWVKRRTGSGTIEMTDPLGATQAIGVTGTWQRFSRVGSASTSRTFTFRIVTSGDAIDVWVAQLEDGAFMSSEIPTTTVAVTRGADFYSLPFAYPPTEVSVYEKFVEEGTVTIANARLFAITNSSAGLPELLGWSPAGVYQTYHSNSIAIVQSSLAAAPANGNVTEFMARLFGDGSVDATQSINGAASTSGAQTAANALQAAWASPASCYLNQAGNGTGLGFTALQSFKIVAGMRSLDEMRNA